MRHLLLIGLLLGAISRGGAQPISLVPGGQPRPATRAPVAPLARGVAAPAFRLQDTNGKVVALQDFRGKVVYLDIWGSWCRPCMAEMPAAAELKKRFLGRDVVFVYIANELNVEAWKQTIEHHALASSNSVHLLDPDGLRAVRFYHVDGYPAYLLIDRQGRVLDGDAPPPSAGGRTVRVIARALAAR